MKLTDYLIDDWKQAHKKLSVIVAAIGAAITGFLLAFPDAALQAWNLLPPDLKNYLPSGLMPKVSFGLFVLSIVGRLLRQSDKTAGATNGPQATDQPN